MLTLEAVNATIESLIGKGGDLWAFMPETILSGAIVVLLLVHMFTSGRIHLGVVAFLGVGIALWVATEQWAAAPVAREIFGGLLVYDMFTIFFRVFLLAATLLLIALTMMTGIPDAEDSADFFTLLLGSVLGMSLMASANNLLMLFLAVEMASVPSYALAGFLKGRQQSSEAALKYVVYGGAAAGVMLYGLSLLAGLFGTIHVPTLAQALLLKVSAGGAAAGFDPVLLVAIMLVLVGIAFKLSAVPFHFWCPDVFEGAAAEVAAFLSIASKGAAVALVARFTTTMVGMAGATPGLDWAPAVAAMGKYFAPTLAVMAAVTCTFGNLAAYSQTNLKRLLAYSTIAHAGYMMMALVPMTAVGVQAALVYLVFYLFMNLGAFAVVAFVRNRTGSESLDVYKGLIHRAPWLTVAMSIFVVSLTGLPPLAGFIGKFLIFAELYRTHWYSLLIVGGVNTVISLVYYVNVMRVMVIETAPESERSRRVEGPGSVLFAGAMAALVLWFGIFFQRPLDWSKTGAMALRRTSAVATARQSAEKPILTTRAERR